MAEYHQFWDRKSDETAGCNLEHWKTFFGIPIYMSISENHLACTDDYEKTYLKA